MCLGFRSLELLSFFFGGTSFRPCECMLKGILKQSYIQSFTKGEVFVECWAIINLKYNNKKRSLSFKKYLQTKCFFHAYLKKKG